MSVQFPNAVSAACSVTSPCVCGGAEVPCAAPQRRRQVCTGREEGGGRGGRWAGAHREGRGVVEEVVGARREAAGVEREHPPDKGAPRLRATGEGGDGGGSDASARRRRPPRPAGAGRKGLVKGGVFVFRVAPARTGRPCASPRRQMRSIAATHSTTEATWMAQVGRDRALAGSLPKWRAAEAASCGRWGGRVGGVSVVHSAKTAIGAAGREAGANRGWRVCGAHREERGAGGRGRCGRCGYLWPAEEGRTWLLLVSRTHRSCQPNVTPG